MDLPNEIQIALNRNHAIIIKFSFADDPDCKRVKNVLVEFVQELERRAKSPSSFSVQSSFIALSNRAVIELLNRGMLNVDIVKVRKASRLTFDVNREQINTNDDITF